MKTIKNIIEAVWGGNIDSGWDFVRFCVVWMLTVIGLCIAGNHWDARRKQEILRKHGIEMTVDEIIHFKPIVVIEGGKVTFRNSEE